MKMIGATILLVCIAGLSAGITASVYRPGRHDRGVPAKVAALRERWHTLAESDRRALVEDYQTVSRRADAVEIFRRARAFASSSAEQQELLRSLHGVLEEVLARLPAARRALLLSLHPHARAEAVYSVLQTDFPETVEELRQRLGNRP